MDGAIEKAEQAGNRLIEKGKVAMADERKAVFQEAMKQQKHFFEQLDRQQEQFFGRLENAGQGLLYRMDVMIDRYYKEGSKEADIMAIELKGISLLTPAIPAYKLRRLFHDTQVYKEKDKYEFVAIGAALGTGHKDVVIHVNKEIVTDVICNRSHVHEFGVPVESLNPRFKDMKPVSVPISFKSKNLDEAGTMGPLPKRGDLIECFFLLNCARRQKNHV